MLSFTPERDTKQLNAFRQATVRWDPLPTFFTELNACLNEES